ncbi:PREDICTED: histone-lysine N-methyltransferase SETMAR-like [Cyphomyrmex costatus]|uniref:histone-lysine N-methyltransferase SETMAR-like n=1 Tax=Cyphomyrmex costatus TaxID=456900 RepID=UPI00085229F1|nr:PREDICTED: histone-lysine N-methyltransferase SETMAR-like [Cyphomyrmex costatus]
MSENKVHFRHILLYYFKKERAAQKWFAKFRSGDTSLEDGPRSGRPTEVDSNDIKALVEQDRTLKVREIAETLKIAQADRGEPGQPHIHLQFTSEAARKRPVSQRIVTGDEKWITYYNIVRKRSWGTAGEPPNATPKAGLHPKKILLSIWWDHRGLLFYELLPQGKTIDSKVYCTQITKLNQALRQKRPELVNRKGVISTMTTPDPKPQ